MAPAKVSKGSRIARLSAARLAAVQAVYQMKATGQGAQSIIGEYKSFRLGKPVDGHHMVTPDGILFEDIVAGVAAREPDLRSLIDASLVAQKDGKFIDSAPLLEPLLDSILLCGAYELLGSGAETAVIISGYLEVTHAFYEGGESRLVNGVLDNIGRSVRG